MKEKRYMTAKEAARELDVSLATLYAYVSRGAIRSEERSGATRSRLYRAEDIRKLTERKAMRRDPEKAARGALDWGTPVLESAITLIADGALYYRGHDATKLARTRSVEDVAGLIWNGSLDAPASFVTGAIPFPPEWKSIRKSVGSMSPSDAMQVLLPIAARSDDAAFDLRPKGVLKTGARIMQMMTGIASGSSAIDGGIAEMLAAAWAPSKPHARELINAALILAADHELNVSSFTVRCVASAGGTPYAAIVAGLAALGGSKHGGYTERVEAMLREIGRRDRVREALASRLRRGELLPGFGHSLYPDGDPRGRMLLEMAASAYPRSTAVALSLAVTAEVDDLTGDGPTIDLGLVTLARALGLPDGSALTLFAIGRTIGWIGHAIEQYALDRMIRPRARYVGARNDERRSA